MAKASQNSGLSANIPESHLLSRANQPVRVAAIQPPCVYIPDLVLGSDRLASFMAGLATVHGPVFTCLPRAGVLAGRQVAYFVGPEANRFVLLTHREHFSHDQGWTPVFGESLGKGLANMDPPEHPRHRALMNPAFTAPFLDRFLPLLCSVVAERTRNWAERGEIDLTEEVREISFAVAAGALMGLQTRAEVNFLRDRFYALLHPSPTETQISEQALPCQKPIRDELNSKLLELITSRRHRCPDRPPDNVLDMLACARDGQGYALSDEQLLAHLDILLVAGHETTTSLGAWLLYLLATHPKYGARVDEELAFTIGGPDEPITSEAVRGLPILTNAIREAGRLQPPVMFLPRGIVADVSFAGYQVQAGTAAFLAVAAGHRLPTIFADPDSFDPDRFAPPREEDKRHPYALVTFGGGPRVCLGVNLAHMELKVLAAHIRRRFRLTPIPGIEIVKVDGVMQCLPEGIRVWVDCLA